MGCALYSWCLPMLYLCACVVLIGTRVGFWLLPYSGEISFEEICSLGLIFVSFYCTGTEGINVAYYVVWMCYCVACVESNRSLPNTWDNYMILLLMRLLCWIIVYKRYYFIASEWSKLMYRQSNEMITNLDCFACKCGCWVLWPEYFRAKC